MKKLLQRIYDWFTIEEPRSAVEIWAEQARADYRELRYRITTCCTPETMDKLEICIDRFENHYANLIPLSILHPMVVDLVDRMMRERGRIYAWANN